MGNILFGEKCKKESAESIINLSDNCVGRLTKEQRAKCGITPAKGSKSEDDQWMKKLKCLDDIHSQENGLTQLSVECLLCKVGMQVDSVTPLLCPTKALLQCLKDQKNCMIKCKKLMDEYIDCIDTYRINAMKARLEESRNLEDAKGKKEKET